MDSQKNVAKMDRMTKAGWTRQEPGWYTSEAGGICKETSGWYFHPQFQSMGSRRHGPYKTLAIAMQGADAILGGEDE